MYSIQSNTMNKVIYDYWLQMQVLNIIPGFVCTLYEFQAKLIYERKCSSDPLHLGGDGKYDSPGEII